MEQTSRLSIVIDMSNAESNLARLRQILQETTTAGTRLRETLAELRMANPFQGLASAVNGVNGAFGGLGRTVNNTNNVFNAFNRNINNTSNTFNNISRTVNNTGNLFQTFNRTINTTNNNIVRLGDTINRNVTIINNYSSSVGGATTAVGGLSASLSRLHGLLMGGIFATTALSVAKTADTMQNLHSQIKLVTSSSEEYQVIQERLHEMANKNLTSLQSTIGLYTNSARSLGQLGKSQEEVLKFTNAISLAMNVGGKSAQEQSAALLQLGQAMQSGVVQGDEFRSLAENAPILLDLVAESLGKTRGEVRKLSSEGAITAEVMYQAVANATPKLQAMFDQMPVTMAQAFGLIKNNYQKFVHEFMNGEGGISSVIAKGLTVVSKNVENLSVILMGGVTAWGAYALAQSTLVTTTIPALITGIGSSVTAFYAQGVATYSAITSTLTLANAHSVLTGIMTATTAGVATFTGILRAGTTALVAKTLALVGATRAFVAHSASVVRANLSLSALRVNLAAVTASLMSNTTAALSNAAAFLRSTVAVQAKTLALGAMSLAGRTSAGVIGVLTGSVMTLGAVINAHPLMFLGSVIFAIIASTEGLQGAIDSLGDTVKVVGSIFGEFITVTASGLKDVIGSAIDWTADKLGKKSKESTSVSSQAFNALFGNTEKGFLGVLQVIARVFDLAVSAVKGFAIYGGVQFDNMVIRAKNAYSSMKSLIGLGDGHQEAINSITFNDAIGQAMQNYMGGGAESLLMRHVHSVTLKAPQPMVDLNKSMQANTQAVNKSTDDKKKSKKVDANLATQQGRMMMVYNAAKNAGFADEQARQLTAQVGREGDYKVGNLFGTHVDMKNGKVNLGAISWQGERGRQLFKEMEQLGFIKNGKMLQTQEALDYQFKFLAREMANDPLYDRTRRDFMYVENPTYDKGMPALDDDFVRWDTAGKKIKNVPEQYAKQKRYYDQISNLTKNYVQDVQGQQKTQQDLVSMFLTREERQANEFEHFVNSVRKSNLDKATKKNLLSEALLVRKNEIEYNNLDFELQTRGHLMDATEKSKKEYELSYYDLFSRKDLNLDQKNALLPSLVATLEDKLNAIDLKNREKDLELNGWRKSRVERLQIEKDIYILRMKTTDKASEAEIQSAEAWYDHKINIAKNEEELSKRRLEFEAKQYDMLEEDKILANTNIALLELATREDLSDEERKLHEQVIDAKYKYDMEQYLKNRNKMFDDAKNDYQKLLHIYKNPKDKYAVIRYELQKEGRSEQYQNSVIEQYQKKDQLQTYMDLQSSINDGSNFKLNLANDDTGSYLEISKSISSIISANDAIKQYYANMFDDLRQEREAWLITQDEYNQRELELQKQHLQDMSQLTMGGAGNFFGAIANMGKVVLGEQSNTYKEMFKISKAFYTAQAGMNVYKAASDAYSQTDGSVWVKAAAAAKAVVQSTAFLNLISSANLKGFATGGYTGDYGTSQIAGVVHGQEYVLNASATKRLGRNTLDRLNNGGAVGGQVNVIVNNYSNEKATVEQQPNGDLLVTIGKQMSEMMDSKISQYDRNRKRQGWN